MLLLHTVYAYVPLVWWGEVRKSQLAPLTAPSPHSACQRLLKGDKYCITNQFIGFNNTIHSIVYKLYSEKSGGELKNCKITLRIVCKLKCIHYFCYIYYQFHE